MKKMTKKQKEVMTISGSEITWFQGRDTWLSCRTADGDKFSIGSKQFFKLLSNFNFNLTKFGNNWRTTSFTLDVDDDFPDPEEMKFDLDKLKDFLEYFENMEYYALGLNRLSGGFVIAEHNGWDDEVIYIDLKWGVKNDVEDTMHTEYYRIHIEAFNEVVDNKEIYALVMD